MTDKTAPRVTIIHHPDVRRMLMLQKAYAEGMRALVLYTAVDPGRHPAHAAAQGRTDEDAGAAERPAAAGGQGGRPRTVLRDAQPWPLQTTRRLQVPPGLPGRSSTSGTRRSTACTRGRPGSRAWTCSSGKIVRDNWPARSGRCSAPIKDFAAAEGGNGRLKAERAALARPPGTSRPWRVPWSASLMGSADQPEQVYKVGLNTTAAADGARRPGRSAGC